MTAEAYPFDMEFLKKMSPRIVNEVEGVSLVTYDTTSKPPSTIELQERGNATWLCRDAAQQAKTKIINQGRRLWWVQGRTSPGVKVYSNRHLER